MGDAVARKKREVTAGLVNIITDSGVYLAIRAVDGKRNAAFGEALFYVLNGMVARFVDERLSKDVFGETSGADIAPVLGAMMASAVNSLFPGFLKGSSIEVFLTGSTIYCYSDSFRFIAKKYM